MRKILNATLIAAVSLLFTACTNSEPAIPDTPSFKQGQKDGCNTASGTYTKNSDSFKMDVDYKNGWHYGRKSCNPAQSK